MDVATQVPLSEETRSELFSKCDGIRKLTSWLDGIDRRPGLDELDSRLSNLEINVEALEDCIGYSQGQYQRNVIKKTDHYELVAIVGNQPRYPHPCHVGSDCAFYSVRSLYRDSLRATKEGLATAISQRRYLPGEVCMRKSQIFTESRMMKIQI